MSEARGFGKTRRRTATKKLSKAQRAEVRKIVKSSKEKNYYVHDSLAITECNTTFQSLNLTANIVQGDGIGQRVGDKVELTSITGHTRFYIENGGAAGNINAPRYMLIQWHPDTNVETPEAAKLFQDSTNFYISELIREPMARSKFTVIYDSKYMPLQWDVKRELFKKFFVKGSKIKPVMFNGDATTGKNHIYEIWFDHVGAGSVNVQMQHQLNLNYCEN